MADLCAALTTLLVDMFSTAGELRRFLQLQVGKALVDDLPSETVPLNEYAVKAAQHLFDRGLMTDELFDSLVEEFPAREEEILNLRRSCEIARTAAPPVQHEQIHGAEVRQRYLQTIISTESKRCALHSLVMSSVAGGGSVPIHDVYVEPRLRVVSLAAVAVSTRRTAASPDSPAAEAPLREWLDSPPSGPILVCGAVGIGKTEELHQVFRELAENAMADASAPLPMLLSARDLGRGVPDRRSLAQAAGIRLPLQADNVQVLLADEATRWIVLIDGLDEADPAVLDTIQALCRDSSIGADHVVVTSRPISAPGFGLVLEQPRWDQAQADALLDRLERTHPEAVRAVRASEFYRDGRGELVTNPLTATLLVMIARRRGALPATRFALIQRIEELLFQEWASTREHQAITWHEIAPALQRLALRYLRERLPYLPEDLVRRELRNLAPHRVQELERASERVFGVLVRQDDGRGYDFIFRAIAEHSAGSALLEQGREAVLAVAGEPWAEELVRHAIGGAADRGDMKFSLDILDDLLDRSQRRDAPIGKRLRTLLIATRATADIRQLLPEPMAITLGRGVLAELLEEKSVWIGDRVADAVQALTATDSPIIDGLWQECFRRASEAPYEPALWYAAQEERSVDWWVEALHHRDAEVRAIACTRLQAHVDEAHARQALFLMLFDEGIFSWPALSAGFALRHANRDGDFEELREGLNWLLETGGQISAGAAALALKPDEADPRKLVRALVHAWEGTRRIPTAPIDDLASTDVGRQALDTAWPSWQADNEKARTDFERLTIPLAASPSTTPPLSQHVRRRILRAFSPGLHRMDAEELRAFLAHSRSYDRNDLCIAINIRPAELLPCLRLDERSGPIFTLEAQRALGRAAARHTEVRAALLAAWENNPDAQRVSPLYPAIALEPLVLKGDLQATAIYKKWFSLAANTFVFSGWSLDHRVFRVPAVHEAGLILARRIWDEATTGYMRDGKRMRYAPGNVGIVLRELWPAWIDDPTLAPEVPMWLDSDGPDKFTSSVWALSSGPLPQDLRSKLCTALYDRIHRLGATTDAFYSARWLKTVEQFGAHEFKAPLIDLARQRTWVAPLAASIVIEATLLEKREAEELAESVAGNLPGSDILDDHHLRVLVRAAPDRWFQAAMSALGEGFPDPTFIARMLPHFDADHQRELLGHLSSSLDGWVLPWVRFQEEAYQLVNARPSDIVARLLFETDVPE